MIEFLYSSWLGSQWLWFTKLMHSKPAAGISTTEAISSLIFWYKLTHEFNERTIVQASGLLG